MSPCPSLCHLVYGNGQHHLGCLTRQPQEPPMTTRISRDAYGLRLAEAAASRADCTRRQVGAVIVAVDGSVVSTGYNGLASGRPGCLTAGACPRGQMAYPTEPPCQKGDRDTYTFAPGAQKCHAEQDGSGFICTREDDGHVWHVAGTGSQVAAVWPAVGTQEADTGYEATGCRAVHAEVNAIIRVGRDRCIGATIYVTDEPCFHCSVVIEGAGIARVVTPEGHAADELVRETEDLGLYDDVRSESPSTLEAPSVPALPTPPDPALVQTVISTARHSTSGPLDPEIHAALVRAVERARAEEAVADLEHEVREDIRADFLNDDGLSPWER